MIIARENGQAWNTVPYEWKSASVNVAGTAAATNIRTITGFTTLFDTVNRVAHIIVEASGTAYIRLNSASNDVITIGATTPFSDDYIVTESLFISTNGSAITITVKLR